MSIKIDDPEEHQVRQGRDGLMLNSWQYFKLPSNWICSNIFVSFFHYLLCQ